METHKAEGFLRLFGWIFSEEGDFDGFVDWTEYYSYDRNGERMEYWTPERGGQLDLVRFTDMTATVIFVDGFFGEVCREGFFDDGFIKEFRAYQSGKRSETKLVKKVTWEYDAGRKNIRRTYSVDRGAEELETVDDLRFELDSEGRVVRCVNHQSVTEYRYEGNRRIETVTAGTRTDEYVYEKNRLVSSKKCMNDGTVEISKRFYPNVNEGESFAPNIFDSFPYLESRIVVEKDGTETPVSKVEFTDDGKPLREINLEDGVVSIEYQYGSDGKLRAVLHSSFGDPLLTEAADIKSDQYGNLAECAYQGVRARYEWIRRSDVQQ